MRSLLVCLLTISLSASETLIALNLPDLNKTRVALQDSPYAPVVDTILTTDNPNIPAEFRMLIEHCRLLDSIQLQVSLDESCQRTG